MSYIPTGASRQLSRATIARRTLSSPTLATKQVLAPVATTTITKMVPPTKAPAPPPTKTPPPLPSSPLPGSSLSAAKSVTSQPVSAELPSTKAPPPVTFIPAPSPRTMEPAPTAVVTPTIGPRQVITAAPSPSSFSSGGGAAWSGGAAAAMPIDIPEEMLEPGMPLPTPPGVPWKLVGLGALGLGAAWLAWKKWGKK